MSVGIVAVGAYAGPDVITNEMVAERTGIPADKIEAHTGIRTRRYAPGVRTSELAHHAVADLLTEAPGALYEVGELIVATSTPDQPQPATAAILHGRMHLPDSVSAWDLNAVCSGGLFGLTVGASLVSTQRRPVLVVAADRYSGIVRDDWGRAIFGDGAGAVLLAPVPSGFGLLTHRRVTHGGLADLVEVPGGGTRAPLTAEGIETGADRFRMEAKAVRRYAVEIVPELVSRVLTDAELTLDQVDRFVFHQANPELLRSLGRELGVPHGKIPETAPELGNVGAASMFVTLAATHRDRPFRTGDLVVFAAIGGGMNAGAAVMRWWNPSSLL